MSDPVGTPGRAEHRRGARRRRTRTIAIVVVCLAVATVLWFWVFPWVDRTFVNRPQVGL